MVAAISPLPVVGVPVRSSNLQGLDSLLSIVQMPGGVPVASVAINNGKNAGLLAVQMLGGKFPEYRQKMIDYKNGLNDMVLAKAEKMEAEDKA